MVLPTHQKASHPMGLDAWCGCGDRPLFRIFYLEPIMKQQEAGKGSAQRPTDHQKFAENYERIFNKTKSSIWPFPTKVLPDKAGNPKFNPDNHEEAPF